MSALSRRATLVGVASASAALPALAIPAVANTATVGPDHPDAELLRLGFDLEKIEQEWIAQTMLDRKCRAAREAVCVAAGLPERNWRDFETDDEQQQRRRWHAYMKKRDAIWYEGKEEQEADADEHGASIAWNRIHNLIHLLLDAIRDHKPQTVAGLAVMTRAVALWNAEWWLDSQEETENLRGYIEAASLFLGITPAPMRLSEEV
jgi:hypothetical protein